VRLNFRTPLHGNQDSRHALQNRGLAGIALGVLLVVFEKVFQLQLTTPGQAAAYSVIRSLIIATFGIAGIGVLVWLIRGASVAERHKHPHR